MSYTTKLKDHFKPKKQPGNIERGDYTLYDSVSEREPKR